MALESKGFKVSLEFITPVLGTQPTREIASEFLAQKNGFDMPGLGWNSSLRF